VSGRPSTCNWGSHRSKRRGVHQLLRPSCCMTAGTSSIRTMVASIRIAPTYKTCRTPYCICSTRATSPWTQADGSNRGRHQHGTRTVRSRRQRRVHRHPRGPAARPNELIGGLRRCSKVAHLAASAPFLRRSRRSGSLGCGGRGMRSHPSVTPDRHRRRGTGQLHLSPGGGDGAPSRRTSRRRRGRGASSRRGPGCRAAPCRR
jgi:hypothetical protein